MTEPTVDPTALVAQPTLATTSVKATVRAVLVKDVGEREGWAVRGSRVLLEPYLVLGGWPTDVVDTTVVVRTGVNVAGHTGSAQPQPPAEIGHDAVGRWIGGSSDYEFTISPTCLSERPAESADSEGQDL